MTNLGTRCCSVVALAPWLLILGCSGSGSTKAHDVDVAESSSASSSAASAAPAADHDDTFSVLLKDRPGGLVVDGKLGDWGDLGPDPKQSIAEPRYDGEYRPDDPLPAAPNPANAGLKVAVVFDKELVVAARLNAASAGGFWFGVGALAPMLPAIGEPGRAINIAPFDCEYEQACCNDGDMIRGEKLAPEVAAKCRETVSRYEAFGVEYAARFERVYRIDETGVSYQESSGKLARIADAKVVFTAKDGGAEVEAAIPLAYLPRMSDAPVGALRFIARASSRPAPKSPTAEQPWNWLTFPKPVVFEPQAALRALVFADAHSFYPGYSPALSYQPAAPDRLQSLARNGSWTAVEPNEGRISESYLKIGETTVDLSTVPYNAFIISKGGELKGRVAMPGELSGMCFAGERDGELHWIHYSPGARNPMAGWVGPHWWLLVVHPDGTYQEDALAADQDTLEFHWEQGKQFSNKDCTVFGTRGPEAEYAGGFSAGPRQYELTWKWDKKQKKYVAKKKQLSGPPP